MIAKIKKTARLRNRRRGQIWVSAVLYILIAAVVMVLVLEAGIPLMEEMRDRTVYQKTKDSMITVDQHMRDVMDEGVGSQRMVPIEIRQGELTVEGNDLKWEMDTKSRIVEPRTSINFGNVIIGSNTDVSTAELSTYYTLENNRVLVNLTKAGTPDNLSSINTNAIINMIQLKENNAVIAGTFSLTIGPCPTTGFGYTELVPAGNKSYIGDAKVVVHMNPNATTCSYNLELMLESEADFIRVDVSDFKP